MKDALRWVLAWTGCYLLITMIGLTGFLFAATQHLAESFRVGAGFAVLGGCLTLILLGLAAPFRKNLHVRLLLWPFLLLPVLVIDLVGTTASWTAGLLCTQTLYLLIITASLAREEARDDRQRGRYAGHVRAE